VITDDRRTICVPNPPSKGYVINVASYKGGVSTAVDAHRRLVESVVDYVRALETEERPSPAKRAAKHCPFNIVCRSKCLL
jgi:hypothetical protein